MSPHDFVTHVYLLSILQLFCHGESFDASLKSPKDLADYPYLSPDQSGHSFAIADFKLGLAESENLYNKYQVNLRIEDWKKQTYKECSFNVTTTITQGLKIDVKTLRRLGDSKKVVLAWNEQSPVVRRVTAMDLDNCLSSDLDLGDLSEDPIVLPTDWFYDGKLHVILANPFRVVRYNSNFIPVGPPREFDVHLEWSSMRVERVLNGDYLAHGFNNRKDFYAYLLYNSTGRVKTALGFEETQKKFISSEKTLCCNDPRIDKTVDCRQFDDNGNSLFVRTTYFDVTAATPLAVRQLGDGEFFLLVGDTNEWSRWDLGWAKWRKLRDGSLAMSTGNVKFQCTGGWDSLVLYNMWRSDKSTYHYGYGCKQGNRYVYHVNSFLAM